VIVDVEARGEFLDHGARGGGAVLDHDDLHIGVGLRGAARERLAQPRLAADRADEDRCRREVGAAAAAMRMHFVEGAVAPLLEAPAGELRVECLTRRHTRAEEARQGTQEAKAGAHHAPASPRKRFGRGDLGAEHREALEHVHGIAVACPQGKTREHRAERLLRFYFTRCGVGPMHDGRPRDVAQHVALRAQAP
jgi:hypothetical protein